MKPTLFPQTVSGVAERVAGFTAHLRENGFSSGVSETAKVLDALSCINITDSHEVRIACKVVFAGNSDHYSHFDELFNSYWFNLGREVSGIARDENSPSRNTGSNFRPGVDESRSTGDSGSQDQPDNDNDNNDGEASHSGDGRLIASKTTNIEKTDFRELMTPESLHQAQVVAAKLATAIRDRRSRRRKAAKRGAQLNLRRILRSSVSHGGVAIRLYRRRPPDRPVKLVALLDVSGSMTVYARVFLSFLKGLIDHDTQTDAYLFHTQLVRISDALRDHDTFRAVNRLSLMAQGFGGGTKIGSNLQLFNRQYAAQTVSGRTVVIVLSDVYDTDPPAQMGAALQRLKKRNCKIIWLNPLKGWKDYVPVAQGMAAALPYIDHFAPANTLEHLAALEPHLKRL